MMKNLQELEVAKEWNTDAIFTFKPDIKGVSQLLTVMGKLHGKVSTEMHSNNF